VNPPAAKRKRPTLRELSALTGLSPAGVSYALRGERVSDATAARVQAEARRIGFRTDPVARALRGGRTGLVGVIGGSLADYWHQEFVSHLQRHLADHELRVLLADAGGNPDAELGLAEELADHRVDGLIVLPLDPTAEGWSRVASATPTVAVNAALPIPARSIRFAAAAGVRLALDHLTELGHEQIVVLGGGPHRVPRRTGVRRIRCGPSAADGCRAALELLTGATRPTAVFALSDTLAYGVYEACAEVGPAIPSELSVVGFDDHPVSALLRPPLTAVGWDTERAAAAAAAMLSDLIEGDAPGEPVTIEPRIVVRESTATPPASPR
jgi:LacI family transcriptional regulator